MQNFPIAPLSLSNVLTVLVASGCLWTIAPQSCGRLVRVWRLAVPPCLAAMVALALLVEVIHPRLASDMEWIEAAILGGIIGRVRGRTVAFQVDESRTLVRQQSALDGLLAASGLVWLAAIDFASAARQAPVVPPEYVAAGAAFCAGFICLRALALAACIGRATQFDLGRSA